MKFLSPGYCTVDPAKNPEVGSLYEGMDAKNLDVASRNKRCLEVRGKESALVAVICVIENVITSGSTTTFDCSSMDRKHRYEGRMEAGTKTTVFSAKVAVAAS